MRYYKEHRKEYLSYMHAQEVVNEIAEEYLLLFQRTQPHSPSYNDVRMQGVNVIEEYAIEVERTNLRQRIADAEKVLELKKKLLDLKEADLRKSHDIFDIVYAAKWIDCKKPREIIRELDFAGMDYSESRIYEITKRIKAEIGE